MYMYMYSYYSPYAHAKKRQKTPADKFFNFPKLLNYTKKTKYILENIFYILEKYIVTLHRNQKNNTKNPKNKHHDTEIEYHDGQPRVKNDFGTDVAEYFLVKDDNDLIYIVAKDDAEDWQFCELYAEVEVTRPTVMFGSMDEIESDIHQIIKAEAVEKGICVTNECGTLFAA